MDLLVRHKAEVASLCPGCHSIMVLSIYVVGLATAFRPHGSIRQALHHRNTHFVIFLICAHGLCTWSSPQGEALSQSLLLSSHSRSASSRFRHSIA